MLSFFIIIIMLHHASSLFVLLWQGIYTSDSVEKSLAYTSRYDNNGGFLLLCEVSVTNDCSSFSYRDFSEGTGPF